MHTDNFTMLPGSPDALALFETKNDLKPGDRGQLEDMLARVIPEREKREAAHRDSCDYINTLGKTASELAALHADVAASCARKRLAGWDEVIATVTACDTLGIAQTLAPMEHQLAFIADATDLLTFKRIPAARLAMLEARLNLRKIEALETQLMADISHARTLEKLSGVFEAEGRVAFIGETTSALRRAAEEAARQVRVAEDALREERKKQLASEQQRFASGQVTRAEAVAAKYAALAE